MTEKSKLAPPPGDKVVSGRHFDLYVQFDKEAVDPAGNTVRTFKVVAVAKTERHGTQRFTQRLESMNGDLRRANHWEVADLDKDGWDDFRYLASVSWGGCRLWRAQRWNPKSERFDLGGLQLSASRDAHGKAVKSCIGRP